jgi:hypothetical protein
MNRSVPTRPTHPEAWRQRAISTGSTQRSSVPDSKNGKFGAAHELYIAATRKHLLALGERKTEAKRVEQAPGSRDPDR